MSLRCKIVYEILVHQHKFQNHLNSITDTKRNIAKTTIQTISIEEVYFNIIIIISFWLVSKIEIKYSYIVHGIDYGQPLRRVCDGQLSYILFISRLEK